MNKAESRYFNTALLMNQALLYLLEKQEIDEITIKSICLKAGVNRSTFYLHYDSIDDLLEETINNLNTEFEKSFAQTNIAKICRLKQQMTMFLLKANICSRI